MKSRKYPKINPDIEIGDLRVWGSYLKNSIAPYDHTYPVVYPSVGTAQEIASTPNSWRALLAAGIACTSTIECTRQKVYSIRGSRNVTITYNYKLPPNNTNWDQAQHHLQGGLITGSIPSLQNHTSLANAESTAMQGFLMACRNVQSSFQGGVFIGELAEAIHGIEHPAKALKDYLTAHVKQAKRLRRRLVGQGAHPRKIRKVLGDLWLEKQYHWGPLANDMESAGKSIAAAANKDNSQSVSFEGFDKYSSDGGRVTITWNPFTYSYIKRYTEESSIRFYGSCRAQLLDHDTGVASFLDRSFGLSLTNALPTLWELIPFSFVADYFSNLGAMISCYSFPLAKINWCNKGTRRTAIQQSTSYDMPQLKTDVQNQYEYGFENPGSFRAVNEYLLRTPFEPKDLIPDFRLEVPGISGWRKWLNLTALGQSLAS